MRRFLLAVLAAVLVVVTAGTALTQVQPGERAVVRRWGRILPKHPGPGLHIGLPWGIDRVDRVPIGSVRRVAVGFRDGATDDGATPAGQMLTGDHNLVNIQAEIDYIVREDEIENFVLLADRADALVERAAESALAEWIAGRTVDEALLRGKALLPSVLVQDINRRLEPYRLGVRVEQVSLTRLNPPDDVRDAFERVAQAQTNIRTQINQAEQEADRKRQEAAAEKFRLLSSATSYAKEQTLQAAAEALAFTNRLEQYWLLSKTTPDYLNVLWQDEVTRLFAKLKESGRVDLLDHHLGADGLNITQFPLGKKR
jgi:membrane protease subunit HflK